MPKFKFDKLIRNKLLDILVQHDVKCELKSLTEIEYKNELSNKLIEEMIEVKEANTIENLTEELADVLEVIDAICKANNIDYSKVLQQKEAKFAKGGTFTVNSFVRSIEFDSNPKFKPYLDHYKQNQDKYPEID